MRTGAGRAAGCMLDMLERADAANGEGAKVCAEKGAGHADMVAAAARKSTQENGC